MDLKEYIAYLNEGKTVAANTEIHKYMHCVSQEALKITAVLNNAYHEPKEIRELMSQLIGKEVDENVVVGGVPAKVIKKIEIEK